MTSPLLAVVAAGSYPATPGPARTLSRVGRVVPRSLFAGLVDDAALFPPGNAPMDRALAEHAEHGSAGYADVVGPFLCPASRVDELVATLPDGRRLDISLVFDVVGDGAHHALRVTAADQRLVLAGVEAAHAKLGDDAATVGGNLARLAGATGYLEVPRTGFGSSLDLVGSTGWHAAKYRTGGTTADAFPTEGELAAFLVQVTSRQLPFKLTAGLHHAVRHTADTGFEQHGVLNVLVATRVAQQGGSAEEVTATLAQRQPDRLVQFVEAWDDHTCSDVRRAFRSFGCCGVTDPIDDVTALGLLGGSA